MLAVGIVLAFVASAAGTSSKYSLHDPVPVIANKVGPLANPTEIYQYYSLPFCAPASLKREKHDVGQYLAGDRRVNTPYDIRFKVSEQWRELCNVELSNEDVQRLIDAIDEEYYFEFFMDDLPMWGFVGEASTKLNLMGGRDMDDQYYILPHMHFTVAYNGDRVIAVNATMDHEQRKQLIPGLQPQVVRFSYSVEWKPTHTPYEERLAHLNDAGFLPQSLEVHWLSIVNSVVLVLLLTAFLSIMLLRIVRNDLTRYLTEDDEEDMMEIETGWKLVHTDVFRAPERPNLFASVVGAGAHLFATGTGLLAVALTGAFSYSRRGAMLSTVIILYALTSVVGGYVSGRLYKQLGGTQWVWNTVTTMIMFPLPLFALFVFLNTTAFAHASIAALPIGTILLLCGIFLIVAFPLTLLGSILGKNTTVWKPPVRTNKVRREIPAVPWYRSPLVVGLLLGGLLPFSAISIEVHYTFAAIWGHKVYTFFGILALAFVLLALVTAFVVVALVYYQLSLEDWAWWWRSIISGGAVSLYMVAYAFVYFFNHSDMSGFLQVSFFFGYMSLVAYAFFLMQAFVGFSAALLFVRYIYAQIKTE